jgi:3-oxoacyl-[acyl-carrier protein] reductase
LSGRCFQPANIARLTASLPASKDIGAVNHTGAKGENMDLGIAGRRAIVCASSKGLGRACAKSLAAAGCEVVINGRNRDAVEAAAADIRQATGATVHAVAADVASPDGQRALFSACPEPDILVNNNAGPPFRDFRELTRQQIIDGVIANMAVAIELTQKAIDPMVAKKFGRIVNITSGTVKAPLFGLDLSSGARAGLTAFMAGVARSVAAANVTINFMQPWCVRNRPFAVEHGNDGDEAGHHGRAGDQGAPRDNSRPAFRNRR